MVLVLLRAFAYSQQFQSTYHQLTQYAGSVRLVDEEIARYRAHPRPAGHTALSGVSAVRLERVDYAYAPGRPALREVSVDIPSRAMVGVIGPSGAGKSTFVQIVLRLRAPTAGELVVNGRPAQDYRQDEWARAVSYVPQEPKLIEGSVADNIRFYRSDLSDDAVMDGARAARIHDEIVDLPLGYGTAMGPRGIAVSGGQRQRICLARAIAGRPELLVLDEPTSALDVRSESLVRQSLRALCGTMTVVIVAHRLSTVALCDWLLVLSQGRVEAFGPVEEVAARGGFYLEALQLTQP
jgi:ABC-type multidrug transport system fused ATPase/permease subunit